jgi:transcriptional regulator with XRE-family HTH domain
MPPIGETLREARMRQKLDIADVEERTKIRAKYLRALENEEWGSLPGPTFVKTFLRTYAEVVGVDPHLLVEEYRAGHETSDEVDLQPLAAPPRRRRGGGVPRPIRAPRPPGRGAVAIALAVALVGFLLVLGLLGGGDDEPGADKAADTSTQTTAKTTPKPKTTPTAPPAGVTVAIAPAEPTYACIDKGEGTKIVFEGTLDQARTFKDSKMIRVNLGKRGLSLTANGKAVRIPESPEPVGYEFTPTATKELEAGSRPCA